MTTSLGECDAPGLIRGLLDDAERAASDAFHAMRLAHALARHHPLSIFLDQVDELLSLLDEADSRAELARRAEDLADALEYAEDARDLACAARDQVQRRARAAAASG